jgi:PAS domain S-box-containing protein/diguanylate cyclase (GGDEF)-like protein
MLKRPKPETFASIVDRIETGVFALGSDRHVTYWNRGAEQITGYLSQEMLGRVLEGAVLADNNEEHNPVACVHACPLESPAGEGHPRRVMTYVRHRAGHVVPVLLWTMALRDEVGKVAGAVKVFSEYVASTEANPRDKSEPQLYKLDPESGLPDRGSTEAFLQKQIELTAARKAPCGVIAIHVEVKDFRRAHGSNAASALVREAGCTLKEMVRSSDLVGRWAEGCFLAILPGCGLEPLERVAARMNNVVGRVAIPWAGDRVSAHVQVSLALTETGESVELLNARLAPATASDEIAADKGAGA